VKLDRSRPVATTVDNPPTELSYAEALVLGLRRSLEHDPRVRLMGQYFVGLTSHRKLVAELRDDFPDRVWYPPIAEVGYVGTGIGAAISGLRPIVDIATASFIFQAFSQVVNEAANIRYMTGGQTSVPVVFHVNHGIRGGGAAQHSHSPQAMLWNTPGLKIMLPSSPRDVYGLLRTALESDDPVFWADHVRLFDVVGTVATDAWDPIPFGLADVKRTGSDVTVVATSFQVQRSLAVAANLAEEGIDVEVVDPRTLVPFDLETVIASVTKTGRLVVVDECHRSCGVAAEIAALVAEHAFDALRGPIRRVSTRDVPIPFSPVLEAFVEPSEARIAEAVRAAVGSAGAP
jgi:acetoin:2,6-dichlorophenolindophenol oxidoreductase subunit beta